MDFMKDKDGKINYYDTQEDACLTCGMYEFENAWVMKLIYNHIEKDMKSWNFEDELWDHYSGLPNPMWYQHIAETNEKEDTSDSNDTTATAE